MSKKLNIVFYGTPEFATGVLKKLHESNHNIKAVVTAPDKPAGRGRKLQQSDVKKFAVNNNIPVLQPTNLKSPDFIEQLQEINPDLQVIVAFRMLPKVVWSLPVMGTFNLHASLLPEYRGAAPINWAIINQEQKTGVTTFFIDDKIDTGAIIDQVETQIEKNENVGSLYDRLMNLGADLSLKTVNDIANNNISTRVQSNSSSLKAAPKLNNENTLIDFTKSAAEVTALIRGLYPYPVAKALFYNNDDELRCKIHTAVISEEKSDHVPPGTLLLKDKKLFIATKDYFIEVNRLQLPGKKAMEVKDLLNGYQFHPNARFYKG
ncbi:methionyl-tRNA formyltransferase [Nonlabens tegetincola]|uniref:Methionyl-tRNA formyltransferase n=1 Tax=Nonlabens tegetincola TaxID=323273 RepID=A0A090QRL6_9FLAO|nr:methionyl-tRNA formyltransferase [Nonlabens tegetincola]GAK98131.1 methionyl-tRNA formyltransferase [Nonlabens tegetincola]